MEIDYTIGDDIVAITNHSQGIFKEGDVKICKGLSMRDCCGIKLVDIGVRSYHFADECVCGSVNKRTTETWWVLATAFRKLDNLVQINEIHELLNQKAEV